MCPSQLFFIVSLLLLLFIINSSRANNNTSSAYCPSSVCNNGLNISYPFWRLDSYYNSASQQYCGYPGFGINCSQTDSILDISDELFNVTNINYSSYSLTLVDIDAVDNRGCPRAHQNLSLGHLPLKYSEIDLYLGFYYNCTRSPSYSANQFDCINPGGNKSYYVEDHETEDFDSYEICEKKVVVPVKKGWSTRGLSAAMDEGFILHWESASNCAQCEASDGRCGCDNSTQESLCFCKNGTVKSDDCNTKVE